MRIIDPPSGWRYGFPKPMPEKIKGAESLKEWLLEQGYPEKDLDLAVKYSRYWWEEKDEKK